MLHWITSDLGDVLSSIIWSVSRNKHIVFRSQQFEARNLLQHSLVLQVGMISASCSACQTFGVKEITFHPQTCCMTCPEPSELVTQVVLAHIQKPPVIGSIWKVSLSLELWHEWKISQLETDATKWMCYTALFSVFIVLPIKSKLLRLLVISPKSNQV